MTLFFCTVYFAVKGFGTPKDLCPGLRHARVPKHDAR